MAKQTKEEKEAEFVAAIELILGFPLMEWQKPIIIEIRANSLAGRPLDLSSYRNRKP